MKLYSKKLYSLEELKKERQKLCKIRKANAPDKWLGLTPSKEEKNEAPSGLSGLLGGLAGGGSGSILSTIMSFAPTVLNIAGGKKANNVLKTIGKEVLGSYLKWKGVELVWKGIRLFLKSKNKDKK